MAYSALKEVVRQAAGQLDPDLASHFERCMMNTLDTTVQWSEGERPFVVTGDIPAMWLRDSSGQLEPYVRFAADDRDLRALIRGVIERQAGYILEDAYANAFNRTANGVHGFPCDRTAMSPWVFERKFEIDSLAHPIRLWWMYATATGDETVLFGPVRQAVDRMLSVWVCEQDHSRSPYRFERPLAPGSDTLAHRGFGPPAAPTGMVWSGFRPSDDATRYPYLIPAEMHVAVAADIVREWTERVWQDAAVGARADQLVRDLLTGIERYAGVDHPQFGGMWAYEVDGLGHQLLMDDANVPSLLSLPYLGFCPPDHPRYRNTRRFVLSPDNPFFYSGRVLSGVGSPHTPRAHVWPMSVLVEAMTEADPNRAWDLVRMVARADGGTGLMHESVHVDNPARYTRPWFAWANSLFAETVLRLLGWPPLSRPYLVDRDWAPAGQVRRGDGEGIGGD